MMIFDKPKQTLNFDKHKIKKYRLDPSVRPLLVVMDKKELECKDRVFMDIHEIYDNFTHSLGYRLENICTLLKKLTLYRVLEKRGGTGRAPKWP